MNFSISIGCLMLAVVLVLTGCAGTPGPPGPAGPPGPTGGTTVYPMPLAHVGHFHKLFASAGAHALSIKDASLGGNISMQVDAIEPADPDSVPNLIKTDNDSIINSSHVFSSVPSMIRFRMRSPSG